MTKAAVGVELNLKLANLLAGEHMKPKFLKLNPQHCIPTLVDNSFSLWEARVILAYQAEKCGKDNKLYPIDPQKRAVVNQRLYFDQDTLYQRFTDYFYLQVFAKQASVPDNEKKMLDALDFLNICLKDAKYVAGDQLTFANLSILAKFCMTYPIRRKRE